MRQCLLVAAITFGSILVRAQVPESGVPARNLTEYEGRYEYRDGLTLFMVGRHQGLIAILGEGKYPLRPATGTDTFTNGVGDRIPFLRDSAGRIVAFEEKGVRFKRLSSTVPTATLRLLEPRPLGPNGSTIPYRYMPPAKRPDGIPTSEAGPDTLSPNVAERLVNGVINGAYREVRSVLVYRNGALVLEEYFYGYNRDRPHQMRSLTKSVISLLAGIAVDRRLLSASQPVLARLGYPAYENPDPRKARVTLTHLLSNQSGFDCNDHDSASAGHENHLYETADWARAFVNLPMLAEPGTAGRYCSGNFFVTGRIIERVTGKRLPEFAQEALFDQLGIRRADWQWNFALDRSQRNDFGQIHLRPRDMLKLGMLIQQRGEWKGRRVVSASWIDAAVGRQSRIEDSDYGLGIWHRWYEVDTRAGQRRVDTIMLSGNGGQKVFLVPSFNLIAVFTGGAFNVESPTNEMMARVLLPALLEAQPDRQGRPDGR